MKDIYMKNDDNYVWLLKPVNMNRGMYFILFYLKRNIGF